MGWGIYNFSSETAELNSTKLDRKQDLNIVYQVCVFQADRKNKIATLPSDGLRHLQLLWNRWIEFKETWQEARSQHPLPSLCISGWSEKQDGRSSLWLAETFLTSSLKPLNGIQRNLTGSKTLTSSTKFVFFGLIEKKGGPSFWLAETFFTTSLKLLNRIQRNLTGSKILMSSTKFVFFGPIGNTRWPTWPLIGWDIFDFSATAEWSSTKLDWRQLRQVLNILRLVCLFRANHYQHVFHSKKRYSGAGLWTFGPLVKTSTMSTVAFGQKPPSYWFRLCEISLRGSLFAMYLGAYTIELKSRKWSYVVAYWKGWYKGYRKRCHCCFCGTSESKCHIGITLSVCSSSIRQSVMLCFCWHHICSTEH